MSQTPPVFNVQQYASESRPLLTVHRISADAVVLLTVVLVICLFVGHERRWLCWLAIAALGAVLLDSIPAEQAVLGSASLSFFHAYLAHLFFSTIVAIAVFTSRGWNSPDLVENRFHLRTLAIVVPCLVLVQIALGAAYRHQFMGVLWHIFGAFVVAIFVLLAGCLIVKQYPQHRLLRPAAVTLMSIAGCQLLLGFAAFVMRLLTTTPTVPLMITTVAHVIMGTLTLAASIVLAIQTRRNLRTFGDHPGLPEAGSAAVTA